MMIRVKLKHALEHSANIIIKCYFKSKLKECSIYMFPQCVFNHSGNMFAAVSENLISIVNIRTGKIVKLNGQISKVSMFHYYKACLQEVFP